MLSFFSAKNSVLKGQKEKTVVLYFISIISLFERSGLFFSQIVLK